MWSPAEFIEYSFYLSIGGITNHIIVIILEQHNDDDNDILMIFTNEKCWQMDSHIRLDYYHSYYSLLVS